MVLNGMVYESAGVTLNWKVPAGDQAQRETQAIHMAWRCRICGASKLEREAPPRCPRCGSGEVSSQQILEPGRIRGGHPGKADQRHVVAHLHPER